MLFDRAEVVLDTATKFHRFLYVSGWLNPNQGILEKVSAEFPKGILSQESFVGLEHGGVRDTLGNNLGFNLQIFLKEPFSFDDQVTIIFKINGEDTRVSLSELITDRLGRYPSYGIAQEFHDEIRSTRYSKVMDLGGRARSKVDRSRYFPGIDYTVVDIVPGENVDVVGDAHKLSDYFALENFDYIVSTSVFEHISMPWKVAIEMNRVLKLGGKLLIQTHQSIGMHDLPWDFFRFSDSSWDSIFNEETGFRIISRALDHENYIIPFLIRPDQLDAEKSAGFEVSLVIAEKISNTNLTWDVDPDGVIGGSYPIGDDGQNPGVKEKFLESILKLKKNR